MSITFTPGYVNGNTDLQYVAFPLDTEHIDYFTVDDSRNWYNNTSHIFAPGIPGVYIISPQADVYTTIGFIPPFNHIITVTKNGTTVIATFYLHPPFSVIIAPIFVEYLNATDYLTFEFTNGLPSNTVSISNWGTLLSVILKDPDYYSDPPKPACGLIKLSLSSNQSIPSGVLTNLVFITNDNYRNEFDNLTHIFQPNIPGYYLINANVLFGPCANQTSRRSLEIWVNGGLYDKHMIPSRLFQDTINITRLIYFNGVSDYLEFKVFQATGQPVILNAINSYGNVLLFTADEYSLGNVSQPVTRTVTAAFENVIVPGNFEVVDWFVPIVNNDNWFNPDTGVFTPTIEGIYLVTSSFYSDIEAPPLPFSTAFVHIYKNVLFASEGVTATGGRAAYSTQNNIYCASLFGVVYMNGTTDNLIVTYDCVPGNYLCSGKLSFSLITNNFVATA
jgi:hypothetical protein